MPLTVNCRQSGPILAVCALRVPYSGLGFMGRGDNAPLIRLATLIRRKSWGRSSSEAPPELFRMFPERVETGGCVTAPVFPSTSAVKLPGLSWSYAPSWIADSLPLPLELREFGRQWTFDWILNMTSPTFSFLLMLLEGSWTPVRSLNIKYGRSVCRHCQLIAGLEDFNWPTASPCETQVL